MTVIVETQEGEIVLLCKGADSVIYERLANTGSAIQDITLEHMDVYAGDGMEISFYIYIHGNYKIGVGLRTLCIAMAFIDIDDYIAWEKYIYFLTIFEIYLINQKRQYRQAALSLTDRELLIDAVAEKIEKNLILLGATAIEDKLQEAVPESIYTLALAGIKLWVLTGDKVGTAINIGFSCNLLNEKMKLMQLKAPDDKKDSDNGCKSIVDQMQEMLQMFWGFKVVLKEGRQVLEASGSKAENYSKHALIIDGSALKLALESEKSREIFWLITSLCNAVLCCRVSPLQKAKVVELVKGYANGALCLAIGGNQSEGKLQGKL